MEQSLQLLGNLADEFHCIEERNDNISSFETQSEFQESNDDISSFETSFQKRTQRNLDFEKKNDFSAERNGDYLRFEYINLCKEYNDLKKLEEPPLPCKILQRRMKKCPPLRKLPKKQPVQDKSDEADKLHVDVDIEVQDKSDEADNLHVDVEEEHVEEVRVDVEEVQNEQLPEEKKNKKNPYREWLPSQRIPKRNIIAQPNFPDVKTSSSENLLNFIKESERNNVKAKTDLIINALQKGKSIEVIFI